MKIFNLTQHVGTPEQITQGLIEPSEEVKLQIQALLTFTAADLPQVRARARKLMSIAETCDADYILIGGLPALMGPLTSTAPLGKPVAFAHSDRVSVDVPQADGSVKKVTSFQHQFFYNKYGEKI